MIFSAVFPITKLCGWPVTPALLCRPSCSFSSPLPQYDSRWLTVIGCLLFITTTTFFYFIFRWHCTFPFIFTHNICVCCSHPVLLQTWRKVFRTVIPVFIPSCLLGENLWVSNWSERVCVARSDRMWLLNLMLLTYALAMCYGFCILQQQASTVLTITGLALNSQ